MYFKFFNKQFKNQTVFVTPVKFYKWELSILQMKPQAYDCVHKIK